MIRAKLLFSVSVIMFVCLTLRAEETVTHTPSSKSFKDIATVLYAGYEFIWVGTEKSGVYLLNKKSGRITGLKHNADLLNKKIQALSDDGLNIWIGTAKGLFKFDRATKSCDIISVKKSDNILSLTMHDNLLYIGTAQGLQIYTTNTNAFQAMPQILDTIQHPIQSLTRDRHLVWLGTENGIIQFNTQSASIKTYSKSTELPDNKITCAFKDNRHIWYGTRNGLCQYSILLDTWTTYTITDGLIDNMITSIEGDGRYVWVGTFMGLSRLDIESQTWENYDTHDNLAGLAINALTVDGDLLWIGADIHGILKMAKQIPQCQITAIRSDEKILYIIGSIADKDKQMFTIEYGPNIIPFIGFRKGIRIYELPHAFRDTLGSWNLEKVTDGDYLIRLQVIDNKGNSNEDYFPLFVDMKPPQITIDSCPDFTAKKKCSLSGSYYGHTIKSITLQPGNKKAKINHKKQKFKGTVTLKAGANTIIAGILDGKGRTKTAQRTVILDKTPPLISLKPVNEYVTSNTILISGECVDEYAKTVEIKPDNIVIKCIRKKTVFSHSISLKVLGFAFF